MPLGLSIVRALGSYLVRCRLFLGCGVELTGYLGEVVVRAVEAFPVGKHLPVQRDGPA